MKAKLALVPLAFAVLMILAACSSAGNVEVSCDDFSNQHDMTKTIEVGVGDTIKVVLCSNATTGNEWTEQADVDDEAVVEQQDHEFIAPKTDVPGTAGEEHWTFKALKKGTTEVSMEYGQPWEGGQKAAWTFKLTVVVK